MFKGKVPLKEGFRPTLTDLLGRGEGSLPNVFKALLLAVIAGACVLALGFVLLRGAVEDRTDLYITGKPDYSLRYGSGFEQQEKLGTETLRLVRENGSGLFLESFSVEPLKLPQYRGEITGTLPSYTSKLLATITARYSCEGVQRRFSVTAKAGQPCGEFELVEEGRARINDSPGYGVSFRVKLNERNYYGRYLVLADPRQIEDNPGVSAPGLGVEVIQTTSAGAYKPSMVGFVGNVKTPYRTLKFGNQK